MSVYPYHESLKELKKKKSKFNNVRCSLGGYAFDSLKERNYFSDLRIREMAGEVTGIVVHPRYAITINGQHICDVVLDFEFTDLKAGKRRFLDVKGKDLPLSRLKRKMVEATYGFQVELA